jgi:hypothetical protein
MVDNQLEAEGFSQLEPLTKKHQVLVESGDVDCRWDTVCRNNGKKIVMMGTRTEGGRQGELGKWRSLSEQVMIPCGDDGKMY